jgi:UDP-glucuronate 4-epimerase
VTILVTGGAGFIGSHLCERLIASGRRVIVLDNFDPFYDPALKRANLGALFGHEAFQLVEADIRDLPGMEAALAPLGSIDVVVHLAARAGVRPSIEEPLAYTHTNVAGTAAVL